MFLSWWCPSQPGQSPARSCAPYILHGATHSCGCRLCNPVTLPGYDSDSAFGSCEPYLHFLQMSKHPSFPWLLFYPIYSHDFWRDNTSSCFLPHGSKQISYLQIFSRSTTAPARCWQCAFVGYHSPLHSHSTNEWQIWSKPAQEH